jgi:MFS family permease
MGQLAAGPIADRWGSKTTTAAMCLVFAGSIVMLMFAQWYTVVMVFAVVYGFVLGAPLVLNPLLTADYLGMKNYGTIFSMLNIVGTLGGGFGSIGAASYHDRFHTYLPVFYFFAAVMLVSALCAVCIKPLPGRGKAVVQPLPAR